jgi:hypothetical protein
MEKSHKKITSIEEAKQDLNKEITPKVKKAAAQVVPIKQYFTIVVEANAPVTLQYRVLADDAEQALDLIKTAPLSAPPKPNIFRAKKIKASVYLTGTSLLKLTKNY